MDRIGGSPRTRPPSRAARRCERDLHPRSERTPAMSQPPAAIVFDVNETLLDLEWIRPTFDRIFSDPAAMRLWFAHLITYSEALTLAGVYVPFTEIGGAVLRMLADSRGLTLA